MKAGFIILLLIPVIAARSQHTNILISDSNTPDEPSIAIDPLNVNRLVAGANLNNVYYSDDGGWNWTADILTSPEYGVWGDPTICCDVNGDFYFFHLSNPQVGIWIDRIVCQKSTDGGDTWSSGTYTGLNLPKQQDKQWPVVDRSNNNIYLTWTEFDEYGSASPADSSRILFSRSEDGGNSWSDPLKINQLSGDCIDSDNTTEGATPSVGPNGEIYVAWSNMGNIYFDRSTDQGETWLDNDILVSDQPGGWDYHVDGIFRCNGLPVTACDTTGGAHHGNIYVNWTDHRNGADNPDVFVAVSSDGGNSWSEPKKVNNDEGENDQFFTWMTLDPVTGYVWFVFYDRRNFDENSTETDVYMAVSYDGCESFQNFKVSESPFVPNAGIFFGDYTNITAHNNVVRPIWTRLHNGDKSIWTAIVDTDYLAVDEILVDDIISLEQNFPNPADDLTYISFKVHHSTDITIHLTDLTGKTIAVLADHQSYHYGKHTLTIDVHSLKLSPGIYYVLLEGEKQKRTRKMLVVR